MIYRATFRSGNDVRVYELSGTAEDADRWMHAIALRLCMETGETWLGDVVYFGAESPARARPSWWRRLIAWVRGDAP